MSLALRVPKFGPIFKLKLDGQDHTVICGHEADLEAWRQADAWNYTDTDSGTFFRREMGNDHVTQLSGEAHPALKKKLILPAFGIKALQQRLRCHPSSHDYRH